MRIGFLPSDFNPMILILGEAEECRALAGALRRFAADGRDLALGDLNVCRDALTNVTVSASPGPPGVHRVGSGHFVWRLPSAVAGEFADRLNRLADPARLAGSEDLTCGDGEAIAVKASRGEYTDDFLAERAPMDRSRTASADRPDAHPPSDSGGGNPCDPAGAFPA